MILWPWVMLGGALGALARYGLALYLPAAQCFSYGILASNSLGCFLLGLCSIFIQAHPSPVFRALIMTGFAGAFTTFSTWIFEALLASRSHGVSHLFLVLVVHLSLGFALFLLGEYCGRAFWNFA